ncbi:MAG: acetolactate synthase small subunit [Candidatus Omnitrophica bacterium]|nr:acetolactate synthase small subunit [Candidatus Omnitrophota bacterium]
MAYVKDNTIYRRLFSVIVENEPGVLARVSGLFSARGFNIVSLAVGETQDPTISRITFVVDGTPSVLEQVNKQLNKLIPVISVLPITDQDMLAVELTLVKFRPGPHVRKVIDSAKAKGDDVEILHEGPDSVIARIISTVEKEPAIFKELGELELIEICRTGRVALSKSRTFGIFDKSQRELETEAAS